MSSTSKLCTDSLITCSPLCRPRRPVCPQRRLHPPSSWSPWYLPAWCPPVPSVCAVPEKQQLLQLHHMIMKIKAPVCNCTHRRRFHAHLTPRRDDGAPGICQVVSPNWWRFAVKMPSTVRVRWSWINYLLKWRSQAALTLSNGQVHTNKPH